MYHKEHEYIINGYILHHNYWYILKQNKSLASIWSIRWKFHSYNHSHFYTSWLSLIKTLLLLLLKWQSKLNLGKICKILCVYPNSTISPTLIGKQTLSACLFRVKVEEWNSFMDETKRKCFSFSVCFTNKCDESYRKFVDHIVKFFT